ncbi:MAG: protein phosphatase 2C domain-containing protein [Acidobacteria bacterium]|nr:protein phosphatase 2C domain-containing protein [Acidobacteriota bacterium]
MRLACAARTDPGRRRATNEDCYCARPDLGLFVVADGMGGHVAGEVAARIAVDEVERFIEATAGGAPPGDWPAPLDAAAGTDGNRLTAGLLVANRSIADRVGRAEELRGMATTAVAVIVGERGATLAHVGDSRAYLRGSGGLERLTRDHSWVEEQVETGLLTPAAAREHPWRNVVTRALSGVDPVQPDVRDVPLASGDRLLLCSDGLSSVLSDAEMEALLSGAATPERACEDLVRGANDGGGPDNITVIVIDVDVG